MRFLDWRWHLAHERSTEVLHSALAMQHFLDLDAADAGLPRESRLPEDLYIYTDGINDHIVVDAPRCRYVLTGGAFHFMDASTSETSEAFVARLVAGVRCVVPAGLLAAVTTTMSRSGLAALERASPCNAAVCGGSQHVEFIS